MVKYLFTLSFISLFLTGNLVMGQSGWANLSGKITDDQQLPLPGVSIMMLGRHTGISSSDSGTFQLNVPAGRAFGLVFSYTGYKTIQQNFLLNPDEHEYVTIRMERGNEVLNEVVVTDQVRRREAGLVVINPKYALDIPAPGGGIESLIKVFVGSNNELTSQYSVRGGSYDENLIYVNDFEVFRPYLVRSGQQEGLSFINPELTRNVSFYTGGFQAKYGDKMSSVLDIQYKKPTKTAGSVYAGLLEQGMHFEGISKNKRFTLLTGIRNRSNQNLLRSQETQGNYIPSSSDWQLLMTYKTGERSSLEFLGNLSNTRFTLIPEYSQLTSSVFSPFFTANLGLDIYFSGREKDAYSTRMGGLSFNYQPTDNLRLKFMASAFSNKEAEAYDITGAYLFGEREFDKSKPDFGMINNPLGAGLFQTYARNKLDIALFTVAHKGSLNKGRHYIQWGLTAEQQRIKDKLHEWEYQDSAGYNLPNNPNVLELSRTVRSNASISLIRQTGYIQDNIVLGNQDWIIQAGLRWNYNSLNKELLLSPRAGFSWKPQRWSRDFVFRAAAGAYHQPPFYRELRRFDGSVNTELLAQKSWQLTAGFDYQFSTGNRPFRLSAETYYKHMTDIVPYDIDNVRIRYFGENTARAYATGLELRLFGELVRDAESWISLGFMRAREDLENDSYYRYTLNENNEPTDSSLVQHGWLRRPTDRMFTFGMFLQDYLSTNQNFKVYLNFLYGSNLPYNIPNSVRYRNAMTIDPYMRIDVGFSALLLDAERSKRRSRHPFRHLENIWLTLEVFNLIDRDNTISYLLIKDFSNTVFAMPNRLTPRLLNLKLVTRF